MQTNNRLFDDLARVASGAAGTFAGLKGEVEAVIKEHLNRMLSEMDLVTREEFDAIKAVAQTARMEQEALAKRLDELEAKLSAAVKKPAAKTSSISPASTMMMITLPHLPG